jgi:DNA (cytosine-5)-methyltransferase 3A
MGWELFSQYVRAIKEAEPKYFIYENNKSMSKAIRDSIDKAFGFEAVLINSALVSAQNRQRLYWVGKRNPDGTYSKVNVEQPADRGILLKDILEGGEAWREKSYCIDANYYKGGNLTNMKKQSGSRFMAAEPVTIERAIPKLADKLGYVPEMFNAYNAAEITDKAPSLTTGSMVTSSCAVNRFEPVAINTTAEGDKARTLMAGYCKYGIDNLATTKGFKDGATAVAEPVCMTYKRSEEGKLLRKQYETGLVHHGFREHTELHPRTDGKTNVLSTVLKDNPICEPLRCSFATPCEWDEDGRPTKAISCADGKTYTVYEVKDGKITIKGKQYPIKLADGFYIIRKLTVRECMRLQTVPEWFEFPVSDSRAYQQLGNGWTVSIIQHLLESILKEE